MVVVVVARRAQLELAVQLERMPVLAIVALVLVVRLVVAFELGTVVVL